jgi:putative DNA primase/helicase
MPASALRSGPRPTSADMAGAAHREDEARARANVLRRWSESIDPRGTLVETYLAGRGLDLPDDIVGAVIRFHPRCPWRADDDSLIYVTAMICAMRSITTDQITAVHRTRLSPDGLKLDRRMLGVATGAAVKLDADENVTGGLHIAEGVESGLAARALGFVATWALGSTGGQTNQGKTYGGIADFPVLGGIECLTILVENDAPSERAAVLCTARRQKAGREVLHARSLYGSDASDAVRRKAST